MILCIPCNDKSMCFDASLWQPNGAFIMVSTQQVGPPLPGAPPPVPGLPGPLEAIRQLVQSIQHQISGAPSLQHSHHPQQPVQQSLPPSQPPSPPAGGEEPPPLPASAGSPDGMDVDSASPSDALHPNSAQPRSGPLESPHPEVGFLAMSS